MRLVKTGFTLVEILVASTIGVFIAMVAVGALRVITASAQTVERNINAAAEVRFAAKTLQRDLEHLYRDDNIQNTKLIGTVQDLDDGTTASYMVFYTVSRVKARRDQPEGDIYEVEYYLTKDEETSAMARRLWPNPSDELEPGGVLSVIAEDIDIFEVRYFDGEEWSEEWPEDMESLPAWIEVTIGAKQSGPGTPPVESFVVNLVRAAGGELGSVAPGEQSLGSQTTGSSSTTGGSGTGSGTGR